MTGQSLTLTLTAEQAQELYDWLESDEAPPYWERPALAALHAVLSEWHRVDGGL